MAGPNLRQRIGHGFVSRQVVAENAAIAAAQQDAEGFSPLAVGGAAGEAFFDFMFGELKGKGLKADDVVHRLSDAIGTITLSFGATDTKAAALGIVLARAHWGHGLGSEAAREVLRYAFETLALEQVTAEAVARNLASLRMLAKLGFKRIESFVDESDGEPCERLALGGDIGKSFLASNAMSDC